MQVPERLNKKMASRSWRSLGTLIFLVGALVFMGYSRDIMNGQPQLALAIASVVETLLPEAQK